jgi:hypothetical protein
MLSDALDASYANNTSSVLSLLEQEDVGIKTALISPWLNPWSKVILEVLIVSQLRTTMHPFYGILSLSCSVFLALSRMNPFYIPVGFFMMHLVPTTLPYLSPKCDFFLFLHDINEIKIFNPTSYLMHLRV